MVKWFRRDSGNRGNMNEKALNHGLFLMSAELQLDISQSRS